MARPVCIWRSSAPCRSGRALLVATPPRPHQRQISLDKRFNSLRLCVRCGLCVRPPPNQKSKSKMLTQLSNLKSRLAISTPHPFGPKPFMAPKLEHRRNRYPSSTLTTFANSLPPTLLQTPYRSRYASVLYPSHCTQTCTPTGGNDSSRSTFPTFLSPELTLKVYGGTHQLSGMNSRRIYRPHASLIKLKNLC